MQANVTMCHSHYCSDSQIKFVWTVSRFSYWKDRICSQSPKLFLFSQIYPKNRSPKCLASCVFAQLARRFPAHWVRRTALLEVWSNAFNCTDICHHHKPTHCYLGDFCSRILAQSSSTKKLGWVYTNALQIQRTNSYFVSDRCNLILLYPISLRFVVSLAKFNSELCSSLNVEYEHIFIINFPLKLSICKNKFWSQVWCRID